jgi:predicted PurR-regulated permease PerM
MKRTEIKSVFSGVTLFLLLALSIIVTIVVGFLLIQSNQLVPEVDELGQAIVDIQNDINRLEASTSETELSIVIGSLEQKVTQISSKQSSLSSQLAELESAIWYAILLAVVLLLVLMVNLGLAFYLVQKHNALLSDYRNLGGRYQKLLGSKRIVDAELRAAREYIVELESRVHSK